MNERMLELAQQAGITTNLDTDFYEKDPNSWIDYFSEKFAELIIKECMTTILKESKWYWDQDEFESSNAVQNAARRVKEHFGVEE